MNDIPPIKIYTGGLLSKWGFHDGSPMYHGWVVPFEDAQGYDYDNRHFQWFYDKTFEEIDGEPWGRKVFHKLVEKFVLPELKKNHAIDGFVYIGSSHNSTRLKMVDGVEIDWYNINDQPELNPEYVEVSFDKFKKFLKEEFDYEI